jgi:hypothetical protein
MSRRICLSLFVLLSGGAAKAATVPGPQCLSAGPCRVPDSLDMLGGSAPATPVLAVNFGLMLPAAKGGGGYEYVCEEIFGGKIGDRARVGATGRMFVPALDGLYYSDDACTWTRASGAFAGLTVWDISFDPSSPGKIWAVGGSPRALALSTDNGATFIKKLDFDAAIYFIRVVVAPSNPKIVYLTGFRNMFPLIMAVSTDGGETFTMDLEASTGMAMPGQVVELLGVAPDDANTLYFVVTNPDGDEVWKSTSQGHNPVKVLTLGEAGQQYGFSFGENPATLYVGSQVLLESVGKPPAYLYFSHDAGKTWDRHPTGAMGPRFRCLHWVAGKLYACGGDQSNQDSFLLGSSIDEGLTWQPAVTFSQLKGVRSCVADKCAVTTTWLCDTYGVCGGVVRPDGGTVTPPATSKGCAVGGRGGAASLGGAILGLTALALRRRRRPQA